jgi:hypothetical protein
MSKVMFSQPMSEVYVVFHKSAICVFAKKLFDLEARKYVSLSGGEKNIVLCLFIGKIQQEVNVATTTTTLHIYYYLYNYKFTIYYLWHWKSHLGFNYQDIILKKSSVIANIKYYHYYLKQLRHTTDDTKLGVTVSLFSMSLLIYNKPFYYK